ncbi:GNAT family N-acetyltransferase [Pseudolysinimonas kribbensis]|uniref:GNAT family N-acetyltransferase n=1 Tax=Pseudolysinimonas kribbensis TaxID=433641 RepID=UPI0024E13EE2|nr:GNAT family N-acetyltransferase [Pseudolysinimonas kribbensis]
MAITDRDLAARNRRTLLACFDQDARGSRGARVVRAPGIAVAVFVTPPEGAYLNNAVLESSVSDAERAAAVAFAEHEYASAGIAEFAIWIDEHDDAGQRFLTDRGYRQTESTLAMSMDLGEVPAPPAGPAGVELVWDDWDAYCELLELPGFLADADPAAYRVVTARVEGGGAEAMAFHHDGDCGIFNVGTTEAVRRRGLGAMVTRALLDDAVARGCGTASLQSTPEAERLYARLGFRALGRIREFSRSRPERS